MENKNIPVPLIGNFTMKKLKIRRFVKKPVLNGSTVLWGLAILGLMSFAVLLLCAQASWYIEQALYFLSTLILWALGG